MSERTFEKVLGEIRYEFSSSDDAPAYRALQGRTDIDARLKKIVDMVVDISCGNLTPTEEQLRSLASFHAYAPSDAAALAASFRKHVLPLVNEAITLQGGQKIAADPTATIDVDGAYASIAMDVPRLIRGANMETYDKVADAFPDEAKLLIVLEQTPRKRDLTAKEIKSLLTLPDRIENHNNFQAPPPTRFLADYKQIIDPLKQLEAALVQSRPVEEKLLGDMLEAFFRQNGLKLKDIYDKHRNSGPQVFVAGRGLDSFLTAAMALSKNRVWSMFSLDRDKLHQVLEEAATAVRADQHPTYGPLARGHAILEDAKDALSTSMSTRTEFTAMENTLGYFQGVRHKFSFAKDAVAKQMQQTQTP